MKLKSVAGIRCYVKDLKQTAKFYQALGFRFKTKGPERVSVYLNWFWMDFLPIGKADEPAFRKEANLKHKGAGMFLYISVDDVDEFYKGLRAKGLKPSSEPRDWSWGNREFVIRDPDGYKLVFFKRK